MNIYLQFNIHKNIKRLIQEERKENCNLNASKITQDIYKYHPKLAQATELFIVFAFFWYCLPANCLLNEPISKPNTRFNCG